MPPPTQLITQRVLLCTCLHLLGACMPDSTALRRRCDAACTHVPPLSATHRCCPGQQDPSDKRKILSDPRLQQLLGVKSFLAFGLNKFLKDHFKGPATGEAAAAAIAAMQAAAGGSAAATSADSDAEAADDSSDFEDEAV
jgi:hypothetical protein